MQVTNFQGKQEEKQHKLYNSVVAAMEMLQLSHGTRGEKK